MARPNLSELIERHDFAAINNFFESQKWNPLPVPENIKNVLHYSQGGVTIGSDEKYIGWIEYNG